MLPKRLTFAAILYSILFAYSIFRWVSSLINFNFYALGFMHLFSLVLLIFTFWILVSRLSSLSSSKKIWELLEIYFWRELGFFYCFFYLQGLSFAKVYKVLHNEILSNLP